MGAEIIGADVSKPVPLGTFQRFKDALHEYKVLAFRDQELSKDQLIAFSKQWGSLGEHIMPGATRVGVPEINVLSNADAEGKPNGKHPDPDCQALAYGPLIYATAGAWHRCFMVSRCQASAAIHCSPMLQWPTTTYPVMCGSGSIH